MAKYKGLMTNDMKGGISQSAIYNPSAQLGTDKMYNQMTTNIGQPRRYVTEGGFGGLGTTRDGGGYTYGGLSNGTPSGLSMDQLVSQYSPEQLGKMDFSNYGAGSLGTDPSNSSWFSQNKDMIGGAAQGLQALSGLANAYMGYKNYGLAKDMFGFNKALSNANYINAAKDYNTQLQNAGEVGMGLAGNTMDANARAARQAQLDSRKVSEAAIG